MNRSILFMLFLILIAGAFLFNRQAELKHLRTESSRLQSEKLAIQQAAAAEAEIQKKYTGSVDVAAFTEELYACTRRAGIRDHVVTTRPYQAKQQLRAGRSRQANRDLEINRLQVDLTGSFRRTAEYIGQVQKLDSHQQITGIKMVPAEKQLETTITIDLYSLGEPNVR